MQAARPTLPSVPITSAAFQSSNSASTNIADTFTKARARIAAEQATAASKPRHPSWHGPPLMTINRARRHRQPTEPAAFRGAVAMRIFVLKCGCVSIQHIARSAAEAFDHGFAELGHLGLGISCRCIR